MAHNKQKVSIALKKALTSLQKVQTMVDDDKYCIDVIQQNLAVIGLLKSVNEQLLEGHLKCCFKTAMQANDQSKQSDMIEELLKVMKTAQKK